MNRGRLLTMMTLSIIAGSFVVVGNLSESKGYTDLLKKNATRSDLLRDSKESGEAGKVSKLAAEYRECWDTTQKLSTKD